MTTPNDGAPRPAPRAAEARRNRERLLAAAARAFGAGEQVSLEGIAREAGVGIGTLYRHFPRREELVQAVYEDQVDHLARRAEELVDAHPPVEAFRRWSEDFVDWSVTKYGMIDALRSLMLSGRVASGPMRARLIAMVSMFVEAGVGSGDVRRDVEVGDVAALLAGVLAVTGVDGDPGTPEHRDQAVRMVNLVIDGLVV